MPLSTLHFKNKKK